MTIITAQMVKELRESTGAGMMECKKALEATQGDIEAAIDVLRASGQAKAAKRSDKEAAEGIIVVQVDGSQQRGCMLEINCETDFVARGPQLNEFAQAAVSTALQAGVDNVEALLKLPMGAEKQSVDQVRQELIAKIGENIRIRRIALLQAQGLVGNYLHGTRIGVLVAINRQESVLARDLAMHIAASNPKAIDPSGVAPELIQREREIYSAQSKESGKPDNIIEKMVEGRLSKFLKEVCLLDQPFVKNPEITVGALLKSSQTQVTGFARFEAGEGIEKQVKDFAEEVKSQLKG